jgi:large subunit ribosomal protein L23
MNKSAHDIILYPLITEKSTRFRDVENKICFAVRLDANKFEIKRAVEELFDIKISSVNTQITRGKIRRFGRTFGKRPNWKKAIVTLAEGQKMIDIFE